MKRPAGPARISEWTASVPHYTQALMSAVPVTNPRMRNAGARIRLSGEIADPSNPPSGCSFHPRCQYARERCHTEASALRDLGNQHFAACHFAEDLQLHTARMLNERGG